MSHEPPVPPDNQSPYPIAEPPHDGPAPLPPVVKKEGASKALLIGGAIAAVGAAAAGLAAILLRRKPRDPAPAARKAPAGGRGRSRTRRGDA